LKHRLIIAFEAEAAGVTSVNAIERLLAVVPVG